MDISILTNSPLFRGLSIREIEMVLSNTSRKIRKHKAGTLIAHSGEPVNSLMIVTEGVVKGEMVDYSGRVIKIEDISAPKAIASAFLFGSRNTFPVNVVSVTDVELLVIEKQVLLKLLMSNDKVLANFLDMISNRSQFLSEKIKFLNFKTIKGKMAQFILQRTTDVKPTFSTGMTQAELADYFGVARPSLARAVGELEDDGLIEASAKVIRVLDRRRLTDLISE